MDHKRSKSCTSIVMSGKIYNLSDITVTPGFTELIVRGLIESNEVGAIALELAPANDNAKELLVNLVELLSII